MTTERPWCKCQGLCYYLDMEIASVETDPRWFRILGGMSHEHNGRALIALGCPMFVPWGLLGKHEAQALRNHMQSLARLNERGGLSPDEMCAVIEDRPWHPMTPADAVGKLKEHLAAWKFETGALEFENDKPGYTIS